MIPCVTRRHTTIQTFEAFPTTVNAGENFGLQVYKRPWVSLLYMLKSFGNLKRRLNTIIMQYNIYMLLFKHHSSNSLCKQNIGLQLTCDNDVRIRD